MSEINEDPQSIFNGIKRLLNLAVTDRNHTFHTPLFNNKGKNNSIQSRVVVLRKFEENTLSLNFHTDFRSPKILDLKHNNKSSFVFYDFKIKIQLRISTISSIHHKDSTTQKAWATTKLSSRKCYLTQKAPSSVTELPEDGLPPHLVGIDPLFEESELGYENFTVIKNNIMHIDWLYLASKGHRR